MFAAHRIKVSSCVSFCISYSHVRQTESAISLTDTRIAVTEPRMSTRHQCEASTYVAPRCTLRNSRRRLLPRLPLPIPTPLKLSLLTRAPECPRLRLFVLAAAAVVVPRLYGLLIWAPTCWLHAETAGDWFNRALTPLFYLVPRCHVMCLAMPGLAFSVAPSQLAKASWCQRKRWHLLPYI